MSRAAGSRAFDAFEHPLAAVASRHPRLAFSMAARLGEVRNRLSGRWPAPKQVRSLFPQLGRGQAARIAWRIGGLEARNRLLIAYIQRAGLEPVRPLVRGLPTGFTALTPPLILGTFHVGAMNALGAAIERLPGPVLALRQTPLFVPRPPVELAATEGDDQSRAALFHRALTHLESGGFVVTALDLAPGPALEVSCLGRTLALARGPFALARLTGAPLVPLVASWRRGGIEVAAGEELAMEDGERGLASAAARWLERYLLERPADLGLGLLRNLLGADEVVMTAES